MKKFKILFFFFFLNLSIFAQNNVSKIVKTEFLLNKDTKIIGEILKEDKNYRGTNDLSAEYYDLNTNTVEDILKNKYRSMTLNLKVNKEDVLLDLVNTDNFFENLTVTTSTNQKVSIDFSERSYYMGVIKDKEDNSLISISIFKNEISGYISTQNGNYIIGKLKDSNKIIIYNDKSIKDELKLDCKVDNSKIEKEEELIYREASTTLSSVSTLSRCVRLGYYTEYDIYQYFGNNVNSVMNYITSLHNQVAVIFLNESIRTPLNNIFIWSTPDQFNDPSASNTLSQFKNDINVASVNGDLVQLLTFRNFNDAGGITNRNFRGHLCTNYFGTAIIDPFRHAVSTIYPFFSNAPNYSWSVNVICHEFGHLFGSHHTHACVWNGNSSAIDGCFSVEGGCTQPGLPTGGGTMMSYCHNANGINFYNGFGPQPGNVMRSYVNSTNGFNTCLINCCETNLSIVTDVFAPYTDLKEASNTLIISNKVNSSSSAIYHSGNEIILTTGFVAFSGSNFRAYKEGCTNNYVAKNVNISENNNIYEQNKIERLTILPNPNSGKFTISIEDVTNGTVQVSDLFGNIVMKKNFDDIKNIEIDIQDKPKGIYILKIFSNEEIFTSKIIKE